MVRAKMASQRRAPKQPDQCALFIGEINCLQVDLEPESRVLDGPQHLESNHDSQRAVEATAIRNGIKVGAEQEGLRSRHCERILRSNLSFLSLRLLRRFAPRNDGRGKEGGM